MSDKLKSMQTSITSLITNDEGDLFCASIGYPELRLPANLVCNAPRCTDEQPILDDSAFTDYASKAEFEEFVAGGL